MADGENRTGHGQLLGGTQVGDSYDLQAQPGDGHDTFAGPLQEVLQGRIVAGMPLSQEQRERIAKRFEELLGRRVKLSCHVDKKQLAGVRVELNGYSYDGTLRGQLTVLHKMLTRPDEEVR